VWCAIGVLRLLWWTVLRRRRPRVEVAVSRQMFAEILSLIARLRRHPR